MQDESQFVPWRTALAAAIVSVLALTLAGHAHTASVVDHPPATMPDHTVNQSVLGLAASNGSTTRWFPEPVTAQLDQRK